MCVEVVGVLHRTVGVRGVSKRKEEGKCVWVLLEYCAAPSAFDEPQWQEAQGKKALAKSERQGSSFSGGEIGGERV